LFFRVHDSCSFQDRIHQFNATPAIAAPAASRTPKHAARHHGRSSIHDVDPPSSQPQATSASTCAATAACHGQPPFATAAFARSPPPSVINSKPSDEVKPPIARCAWPTKPLVNFIRYLPVTSFVPLFILWIGIGIEQRVTVIIFGTFFQQLVMISDVVRGVSKDRRWPSWPILRGSP